MHKVGHQDQDVDGAPAHGEHRRHGDEVVLRALLLGQVQIVVRVLRGPLRGGVGADPDGGVSARASRGPLGARPSAAASAAAVPVPVHASPRSFSSRPPPSAVLAPLASVVVVVVVVVMSVGVVVVRLQRGHVVVEVVADAGGGTGRHFQARRGHRGSHLRRGPRAAGFARVVDQLTGRGGGRR